MIISSKTKINKIIYQPIIICQIKKIVRPCWNDVWGWAWPLNNNGKNIALKMDATIKLYIKNKKNVKLWVKKKNTPIPKKGTSGIGVSSERFGNLVRKTRTI